MERTEMEKSRWLRGEKDCVTGGGRKMETAQAKATGARDTSVEPSPSNGDEDSLIGPS